MAENTPKLAYLLDPLFQIENVNGKPLVGGYIEVYYAGTNEKYITYQNFDFTQNPFKIPLGSDGRAVVLAQTEQAYDVYVRDSFGNLVFSRLNIAPGGAGGVAFGMNKVSHDDTLTGNGTQLSPLGVSPLTNLAVDETMTAYEATVEGKESLVLGVNGDWFNSAISGISNDFVTNETFSACCSAVKGGLDNKVDLSALNNYYTKTETWNTFLPRSGFYLSNYYTTAQTYNRYEIEDRLDGKQDKLTFGYDENSAISSINNSALAGSQGELVPWISGTKHIAETQLMTDNMLIQVLSSFDLSGVKNHCINVKGGMYRFPNQWELASSIQNTNWFMEKSAMSAYVPNSSFSSYTTYAEGRMDSIFQLANSAYTTAVNNYYNKLDISAFSAWSADQGETYTLVGGDNISISSDDDEKTTTISVTGEVGDTTPWISGAKILDETKYLMPGDFFQALSSFTLSGNKNHCIAVKGGGFYMPNNYMLASCINETQYFVTNSAFSAKLDDYLPTASFTGYTATVNPYFNQLFSSAAWLINNKLDISSFSSFSANLSGDYLEKSESGLFYPMTGNPSGFLTQHQDISNLATKDELNSTSSYLSGAISSVSGEVAYISAQIDSSDTYLLKGGYNIGVSSDDVAKETTIYYTGTNGDEQVNQVVRQYSAAGTWLTSHQDISNLMPKSESANFYPMTGNPSGFIVTETDWSNTITAASSYAYNQATAQIPAPFDPTYISGQIDNKLNKSESANYYPMTGNPSGFLTQHQDLSDYQTTADMVNYQTTASMTGYVPMSAVSALINVVQTYSGKWLLNGDL